MSRVIRQVRSIPSQFTTREDGEKLTIEGYFAVFNSNYEIAPGLSESIAEGAFTRALQEDDVRALVNHDTTLVLGRLSAGTLELTQDEHGLKGIVSINPNDTDAMNLYSRVKRGDVNQCSFGFDILDEEPSPTPDGGMHWLIKSVKLWEVSCCTFPAYEETNIEARSIERDNILKRENALWKEKMRGALRNGIKNTDASQED